MGRCFHLKHAEAPPAPVFPRQHQPPHFKIDQDASYTRAEINAGKAGGWLTTEEITEEAFRSVQKRAASGKMAHLSRKRPNASSSAGFCDGREALLPLPYESEATIEKLQLPVVGSVEGYLDLHEELTVEVLFHDTTAYRGVQARFELQPWCDSSKGYSILVADENGDCWFDCAAIIDDSLSPALLRNWYVCRVLSTLRT